MIATFGAWVRQRRRGLDLTQAELADRISYSTITVRRVEAGERRPSRELIDALAAALAVPDDDLGQFRELGRTLVGRAPAPITSTIRPTPVARLQPPPGPALLVPRPQLWERLDESRSVPLTTVVAPAGFGKTVAAAAWADEHGAAWLRLDTADAGLSSLAHAVLDAVRLRVPALEKSTLGPVDGLIGPDADDTVRAEAAAARLIDAIESATRRPVSLVADELEALEHGSPGLRLLEALVRLAHPQLRLVLVSRAPPAFPVDRLRARGQLVEVGAESLRFDAGETARLLAARLGADAGTLAAAVHAATEGWPAAVRLASEALVDTPDEDRRALVDRLGRQSADLFGALAAPLLTALPEPARRLLRAASVLPELDADLCRRLGIPDAEETIALLTGRGALRPRLAESAWALSGVVRACIETRDPLPPAERTRTLRCCAGWLADRGDAGAGLDLLRRAGDAEGCALLLEECAEDLVLHGHAVQVARAADLLRPAARTARVERVIGQALVIVGRWEESLASMLRAIGSGPATPALAYWTGLIHHLRGDLADALAAYDRWRPSAGDDPAAASLVHSMRASALWLLGRGDDARHHAAESLRLARESGDPSALAGAHTALAMLATGDGDRRANDVHDRLALEFAEAAGNALQVVRIRSNRGSHLVETADFELALEELGVALELAELTGFAAFGALARSNRAEALAALGRHEEASADFLAAAETYDRLGSRLVMFPLRGLADLQLTRGELGLARAGYERVLRISDETGTVNAQVLARAGLARVLAAGDPARARALATEALAGADGLAAVPGRLAAGWVLLYQGDDVRARELADDAAEIALSRRDGAGYAEARELAALAGDDADARARAAAEALAEWERVGNEFSAERARFVLAAVRGDAEAAALSWAMLRRLGVREAVTSSAGPLAAASMLTAPAAAADHVRVCLLGPFRAFVGDRPISRWPTEQPAHLLRLLGTHRWLTPSAVAHPMFPDRQPPDAEADTESAIAELRWLLDPSGRLPEDHFVIALPDRIELNRDHVDVDAERFLADAARLLADDAAAGRDSLEAWANLEARYTGDLLEGETLAGEAGSLREECRAAYLSVLRRLIDANRTRAATDEALRYGLRLLRADPYDEATHLVLVDLLAGARRHGEALRLYRRYTARMRELGLEPERYPAQPARRPTGATPGRRGESAPDSAAAEAHEV